MLKSLAVILGTLLLMSCAGATNKKPILPPQYIVDFNSKSSFNNWAKDAGLRLIIKPTLRMKLHCAQQAVLRFGATPNTVRTLGLYETISGEKQLYCLSDASIKPYSGKLICARVSKKFLKVAGSKVFCVKRHV